MKATVNKNLLQAAIFTAAIKDIRSYLNGVCLQFEHGAVNSLYIIATDGRVLGAYRQELEYLENDQRADFELIIPLDAVKAALKMTERKQSKLDLESLPDGKYSLGGVIFSPITGNFPRWRSVLPDCDKLLPYDEQPNVPIDPELLLRGKKALAAATGSGKKVNFQVDTWAQKSAAVMHTGNNQHVIVLMPYWLTDDFSKWSGFYSLESA